MKHTTKKELLDHIFETYLLFGTYSIRDKGMYDAFDLGIKDMKGLKKTATLLAEIIKDGHPHLTSYEISFVGEAAKECIGKEIELMSEEQYETFQNEIEEICGSAADLFCRITEW
jgi:hypothetical protein